MATNMATAATSPALIPAAGYSQLCQELKFASDHLDDIPDLETLRKAVGILEAEAVRKTAKVSRGSTANGATGSSNAPVSNPPTAKELGETRYALMGSPTRRWSQKNEGGRSDRAAKGAFTYQQIKQLTVGDIPAMKAATNVLRKVTS